MLSAVAFPAMPANFLIAIRASPHKMEIDSPKRSVGYSLKIFVNLPAVSDFICAICMNVLRNAVQIPQSNNPKRACQMCYKERIQ